MGKTHRWSEEGQDRIRRGISLKSLAPMPVPLPPLTGHMGSMREHPRPSWKYRGWVGCGHQNDSVFHSITFDVATIPSEFVSG